MIYGKKVIVILPAFNAGKTLKLTLEEIPREIVDEIILTDDASSDNTIKIAGELGLKHIIIHKKNLGYGANQKTCYKKALELGADIIILLHPDYQYTPLLIPSMAYLIANNLFSVVIGSRILGGRAMKGGMPAYKYFANRVLTLFQNICTGAKLSEYHTGYRAFSSEVLKEINYDKNSDGHIFDNEILSQIILKGYLIGEVSCPAKYFPEASSLNLLSSIKYGSGVLKVSLVHFFYRVSGRSFVQK